MEFRRSASILGIISAVVLGVMAVLIQVQKGDAETIVTQDCPAGMAVTKPFNGDMASSIVTLEATVPTSYNAQGVMFKVKEQFLFTGQLITSPYWRASFDSRNADMGGNGVYQVYAIIKYNGVNNTLYECKTPVVAFNVNNPPTTVPSGTLEVQPSLAQWTGPTNVNFEVVMKSTLVSGTAHTDVSQQAAYDWSVTKGVLTPQGHRASISSGPSSGDGSIKVRVTYGGQSREIVIPMKVQSYTESTTYPSAPATRTSTTTQPGATSTSPAPTDQPKTVQEAEENGVFQTALSRNGQGDAELDRCLSHTLGEQEYRERIAQNPRLGFGELVRTEQCFVRRSLVIPANLAPVEPTKVRNLPESKDVKLEKFQKVTKNGKDALEISGVAKPGQTVVIYIFSEPLVLVAKADNDGKWTYVLEDPMEPGDHEAFVTVEGDSEAEALRSAGFGFAIAAAPKTKTNPLGLSFAVQQSDKPKLFYGVYIASAVAVVVVALLMSLWFMRHRAGAAAAAAGVSGQPAVVPDAPAPTAEPDDPQKPAAG